MAAASVGLGLLAACGSSPEPPVCPPVSVLTEAATLTRFAPGRGTDLVDVDMHAEIADIRSACIYAKEKDGPTKLVVAVAPSIVAARGPANESRKADFEYFVSVIGPDRSILNKQLFPVSIVFPGNNTRVEVVQDDPPVSIDMPPGADKDLRYQILLGLQMSEAELRYNRQRAGMP
ncbi:MAG: hypothetical protein JNM75_04835 [Rhodospirillales bacterium]|nr:hypothetical protein [Rhodospirillales bacterium]